MAGADPLGELCRAVEKDAGEENRPVNDARGPAEPVRDKTIGGTTDQQLLHQNDPCPASLLDALVSLYKSGCETENVAPCDGHVKLLTSIPKGLVVDARWCAVRRPRRSPGGAVLRVTSGCTKQVSALLGTLAPPSHASALVLVDTLDFTSVEVSHEALAVLLDNALSWGPWWRLRCLVLRDCGLTPDHIRVLARLDAVPCLWNLEVLDLSDNVQVGTDPATGSTRGPGEYAQADVAFLIYLWKQAKLRRISFKGCGLGTVATECLLKVLRSYHLPREQGLECGLMMHCGTRASLECLELDACDDSIVETLSSLLTALPKLKYVDVPGLGGAARRRLGVLMHQSGLKNDQHGSCDRDSTENTAGNHHDGRDGAIHDTPMGTDLVDAAGPPSIAGATSTPLCSDDFDLATLLPPTSHVLPENEEHLGRLPASGGALDVAGLTYPKLPQQILDDFGLNDVIQNPPGAGNTGDAELDTARDQVVLKATNTLDKYSLNIVSPRRIARRQHRQIFGREDRVDDDAVLPTKAIYLHSGDDDDDDVGDDDDGDDGDDDEASTGTSGSDEDADGRRRERPTIDQINFKMRDGALDEDSKMGRIYRATAKKNIAAISDQKKKVAAKRAFSLWDQCTENSWDRRRWTNPSKTQNDEPHILGQLNLMFDILHEEGRDIGFPFPLWRRGRGKNAFLPEEETDVVMEEKHTAPGPSSDRPPNKKNKKNKKKRVLDSD